MARAGSTRHPWLALFVTMAYTSRGAGPLYRKERDIMHRYRVQQRGEEAAGGRRRRATGRGRIRRGCTRGNSTRAEWSIGDWSICGDCLE